MDINKGFQIQEQLKDFNSLFLTEAECAEFHSREKRQLAASTPSSHHSYSTPSLDTTLSEKKNLALETSLSKLVTGSENMSKGPTIGI